VAQNNKTPSLGKMLSDHAIRLTRRLGQHLLVNDHYLQTVIDNSDLSNVTLVLEIGPGPGNLTKLLLDKCNKLVSVELDLRFCEYLRQKLHDRVNFTLIEKDIINSGSLDNEVIDIVREAGSWGLSANLPYNVASIILVESLYLDVPPKYICVMIQKEVAQRLAEKVGSDHYGVLSVLAQALAEVKIVAVVPPGAFLPPPKVQSAIVKLTYKNELADRITSKDFFRRMVSRLFRHRRKTLRGGWVKMLPDDQQPIVEKILAELNIDLVRRAETLSVDEFILLSNQLTASKIDIDLA
jgi:16S rRNA (adenine1518-N6/adenine1519-N6)-dimethyltransferase